MAGVTTSLVYLVVVLLVAVDGALPVPTAEDIETYRQNVKNMFTFGYDMYMKHAFPHDELKPMSGTYTDSLAELGNAARDKGSSYNGVALTLIDTLDTLAVMGNKTEFSSAVKWVAKNVAFDIDIRVHVFECNIRLLGGLLSAHALAVDEELNLITDWEYRDELLKLARDLGDRLLKAFTQSKTDIPYAWVNLKFGVPLSETRETCTAGVGTLILEFGLLSHMTKDRKYFEYANKALEKLWSMRSNIDLLGNTLDMQALTWINSNAGIGAGVDSFYEYLFKAYVLFGNDRYLNKFDKAYASVMKHLRQGPWYFEASMASGGRSHLQFNSLQAFWPGLQVMAGRDYDTALHSQDVFSSIWNKYGSLPERLMLHSSQPHSTERYYPLRPEFIESTYYLYRATKHPFYLNVGMAAYNSLEMLTRTKYGYASIKDVVSGQLEDRMTSFFLSETCKYLYLLFDEANFVHNNNRHYVFSTEGHMFPVTSGIQKEYGVVKGGRLHSPKFQCPARTWPNWDAYTPGTTTTIPRFNTDTQHVQQCSSSSSTSSAAGSGSQIAKDFNVRIGEGSFHLYYKNKESVDIRNLGTGMVEVVNTVGDAVSAIVIDQSRGLMKYTVQMRVEVAGAYTPERSELVDVCSSQFSASNAFFANLPPLPTGRGGAQQGDFECGPEGCLASVSRTYSAEIVKASPEDGCTSFPDAGQFAQGKIVYIDRGVCTFVEKVSRYQRLGAKGTIVGNTKEDNHIFMMGPDDSGREVRIPSVMITKASAKALKDCLDRVDKVQGARLVADIIETAVPQAERSLAKTAPRPQISGTVTDFYLHAIGGWAVYVTQQSGIFHLQVHANGLV